MPAADQIFSPITAAGPKPPMPRNVTTPKQPARGRTSWDAPEWGSPLATPLTPGVAPAFLSLPHSPSLPPATPVSPAHFMFYPGLDMHRSQSLQSLPQTPQRLSFSQVSVGDMSDTASVCSTSVKENNTNVYVSGLPRNVTDESFLELVSQFGKIFSSKVVRKSAQDPPVGFVQYTAPHMAQAAVQALDGRVFGGAVLKAKMAIRDKDKGVDCKPSANLYICNLPHNFTTADLRRAFEAHGRIVSLVALTDPVTGQGRGTGFVRFSSVKEARLAKEAMHGVQLRPDLPLEVKFAESNADRTQRLKGRMAAAGESTSSPASPLSPLSPLSPTLSAESHHKKQRPTPLKAPATSPTPAPAPVPNNAMPEPFVLAAGVADLQLQAFLDDVFPEAPRSASTMKLADDLQKLQLGAASPNQPSSESWETMGHSEEESFELPAAELSPILDQPWPMGGNVWGTDAWSAGSGIAESRLWRFLDADKEENPASPASQTTGAASSTIKVEGLPPQLSEVELYRLCSPFGAILQVNSDPQGSVFIQFRTPEEAGKAQAKLHGSNQLGATLTVSA